MLELHTYIALLLAISAVALFYMFKVIVKQVKLFKIREEPIIQGFRRKLFALSLAIVIFGLVPISINLLTLFVYTGRPSEVPATSVLYSASVHLQTLFLAYILWRIYGLADEQETILAELERKHFEKTNKK